MYKSRMKNVKTHNKKSEIFYENPKDFRFLRLKIDYKSLIYNQFLIPKFYK